jgi:enoyl-CoA hydratase/carnithine racemase
MSDAYETLKLEVADCVATVTLDRPPVNAMNRAMREEIVRVFDELHDRTDVRAVVLTAAGKAFCAGADLKERPGIAGEHGAEYLPLHEGYRFEQGQTTALAATEDTQEAWRAFAEKRKPVFKGR